MSTYDIAYKFIKEQDEYRWTERTIERHSRKLSDLIDVQLFNESRSAHDAGVKDGYASAIGKLRSLALRCDDPGIRLTLNAIAFALEGEAP